jgi:hypothetical protein
MNFMIVSETRSRRLLAKCLFISFATHAAALAYFYFHPMILQSPLLSAFGMSAAQPKSLEIDEQEVAFLKKNHLLEEVFQQILVLSPHFQQPYDMVALPKGISLAPNEEEAKVALALEDNLHIFKPLIEYKAAAGKAIQDTEEWNIPALFNTPEMGSPIASQLQIDSEASIPEIPSIAVPLTGDGVYDELMAVSHFVLEASYETDYPLNLSSQLVPLKSLEISDDLSIKTNLKTFSAQIRTKDLNLEEEQVRSALFTPKAPTTVLEKKEIQIANSFFELEQYDFPSLALVPEWNDDFDIDVTFLPNPEGKGYIFSLSLKPNCDLGSHGLKQNLYFVLDRSGSVQKPRFAVFKRAILKALSSMQQGDTFNILLIDKKITLFSPNNTVATWKNIQAAEEFLDKQEGGGLFTSSDIYTTIDQILLGISEGEEIHTAILLTDGKTSMNAKRKQTMLKRWVEKNNGKLSLYACAVGRDNDLLFLDMLCAVSGGKLLYSDTHASFPRKLAKLVMDLKDPVAKDLTIAAIAHNPSSHIAFYPANSHYPLLYGHQPYVLFGQIDDPCSFDLIIQGRHRDEWIAIKKSVSFIDGRKGDLALEKQWSAQHANICYSKFLKEGKNAHLKEAKEILKKSRSEVAFD